MKAKFKLYVKAFQLNKKIITIKIKKMKKKILSIALGLILIAFTTNTYAADKSPVSGAKLTPTEKAVKDFNKQFKNSVSPAVYAVNGGLILKSVADGYNVTLAYDKKGNWVYTIKRYPTESLAKDS